MSIYNKWCIGLLIMWILSIGYAWKDDYCTPKPYSGTVVAMSNIESGGKYSHSQPTIGVKLDNGTFYDSTTSVAAYSQWHVGDRIIIKQTDMNVNSVWYRTMFNLFAFLGSVLFLVIAIIVKVVEYIEG